MAERWTIWECDCGAINRASFPGMQHPCAMCDHPATIDPIEVVPAAERDTLLAECKELLEAVWPIAAIGRGWNPEGNQHLFLPGEQARRLSDVAARISAHIEESSK